MFCPNCGTENTNNLPACEKCGASFEPVSQPNQPMPPNADYYAQPQPEKKSNVAKIVIIIAVVGVVADHSGFGAAS